MNYSVIRRGLAIVLAAVLGACASTPDPLSHRLTTIDSIVDPYIHDEKIAGFVGLILHDGKPVYERAAGWADREDKRPMQQDTIFRIASLSKAITAVAALMLIEEGKLSPDEPLSKYIPSFKWIKVAERDIKVPPDPKTGKSKRNIRWPYSPVTIKHLLAHTSGLTYGMHIDVAEYYYGLNLGARGGLPPWYLSASPDPICVTAQKIGRTILITHPGTGWVYGYNSDVLGCIIEKVSGMPLDEFFRTRITKKLGMKDTHFYLPPEKRDRLAVLYGSTDGKVQRSSNQGAYIEGPRVNFSGGAGMLSTAADYARFIEMIRNGGEFDGDRYLKPESVKLMTTNQVGQTYNGGKGYGYSYGFETLDLSGSSGYGEYSYGWFGAYGPYCRVYPREKIVLILMSQLLPNGADMREKIIAEMQTVAAEQHGIIRLAQR